MADEEIYRRQWKKRAVQIAAVAVVIVLVVGFFGIRLLSAHMAFNKGGEFAKEQMWEDALASYEKSLRFRSNNPAAHFERGRIYLRLQRNTEAVAAFNQALDLGISDTRLKADVYTSLGLTYLRARQFEQAIPAFNSANEVIETANAYQGLAEAYLALGRDPNQAVEFVRKALSIQRDPFVFRNHWTTLGQAYQAAGDLAQAEKSYREALSYDENHLMAHYRLALLYRDTDRVDQAIVSARKVVELNPDWMDGLMLLNELTQ